MGRNKRTEITSQKCGGSFVYRINEDVDGVVAFDQNPRRIEENTVKSGVEIRITSPEGDNWNVVVIRDGNAYYVSVRPRNTSVKDFEITVVVPPNSKIWVEDR